MTSPQNRPIVVGYDGSPAATAALRWAAALAAKEHTRVELVHALELPYSIGTRRVLGAPRLTELVDATAALLTAAAKPVETDHPDIDVDVVVVVGSAAAILVDRARSARLVVVGSNGLGEVRDVLAGSVTAQLSMHAAVPVVVVPPNWTPASGNGRVVVGVDGSQVSAAAVDFAFGFAEVVGAQVEAILTWTGPVSTGPGDMVPLVYNADDLRRDNQLTIAECLAGQADKHPDVVVRSRVIRGRPADILEAASRGGTLLVVGSRGHGGFRGLLLGSVSQALIHRTTCPIAIVR